MGIISEKEWEDGAEVATDRAIKIMEVVAEVGKGGIDINGIREKSGFAWPWAVVRNLEENGSLESRKIGKRKYYRVKV